MAVGTYFNWLIVAKRLRRYSVACGAITIPDFFSRRYDDKKNTDVLHRGHRDLDLLYPYTASGFKAVGTLFNSLFGVDYHTAMIVGAVVIIGYTVMGGFMAVSTTDLIQSIVMSIALVIIVFFGIRSRRLGRRDGQRPLPGRIPEHDPSARYGNRRHPLLRPHHHRLHHGLGPGLFWMPHILLRFMAISDEDKLKVSRRIAPSGW